MSLTADDDEKKQQQSSESETTQNPLTEFFVTSKSSKVAKYLDNGIDDDFLNWNIFDLYKICGHQTLLICTNHLFTKLNLYESLKLDQYEILIFLSEIERGYLQIPYHSAIHGTDVMLNSFHCLIQSNLISSDLDKMIIILSAVCHDYKHPGFDTNFLKKTNHPYFKQYGDKSMLEQMHSEHTLQLMTEKKLFQHLDKNDRNYIYQRMEAMILGTDPAIHQQHIQTLNKLIESKLASNDIIKTYKNEVMVVALHYADLALICKSYEIFEKWVVLLYEEWWLQGDKEKELKLGLSGNRMDRTKTENIARGHNKWMLGDMKPLYSLWSALFADKKQFVLWVKQLESNAVQIIKDEIKFD